MTVPLPPAPAAPPPRPFLRRRRGLLAVAAVGVALALWWWLRPGAVVAEPVNPWAGPAPVRTETARRETLALRVAAIGSVTPMNLVTVRARVDGPIEQLLFEEGQAVRAGQPLAVIDPAPYRVKLAQAEAQRAQNAALLTAAERDLAMYERLIAQDATSRQQVDKQHALVQQLRGTAGADDAAVESARLQLGWTRIAAPIAGRTGLRRIDAGNLVSSTDTTGLVTIAQTRPIAVTFSVPEAHVAALRAAAAAGRPLSVQAFDRSDTLRLAQGQLTTFDNQIDAATGTLKLKARFDNGDDALFPNQFVRLHLDIGERTNALTIPADAVQHGDAGPHVYVVKDNKALLRPLVLGVVQDDRVEVLRGLADGDAVALEGLDRLKDGRAVVVVPAAAASAPSAASATRGA